MSMDPQACTGDVRGPSAPSRPVSNSKQREMEVYFAGGQLQQTSWHLCQRRRWQAQLRESQRHLALTWRHPVAAARAGR